MTRGPVAFRKNPVVPGDTDAFDKQGRLRNRYAYLEERILAKKKEQRRDKRKSNEELHFEYSKDLQWLFELLGARYSHI